MAGAGDLCIDRLDLAENMPPVAAERFCTSVTLSGYRCAATTGTAGRIVSGRSDDLAHCGLVGDCGTCHEPIGYRTETGAARGINFPAREQCSTHCRAATARREGRPMITVEFTEAEAQAVTDAVRAYIDDDYYPAIDLEALGTAYKRLTWTIGTKRP